jgi:putative transposase
MPRIARQKSTESMFHIMCKSISEINLFKNKQDKIKYMKYIKKYQQIHKFNVYSYCLMDNHLHLIVDSNGADISQIMHGINFSYAQYFNRKYKRHGHLFQDRFKSKIINTDSYLITASAYIHNNPTDLKRYKKCPEKYEYSSLSVYLGLRSDPYELIDPSFIMGMFGSNTKEAMDRYYKFVFKCDNSIKEDIEFENEGTLYDSKRIILARDCKVKQVIDYVANKTNIKKAMFQTKYNREATKAKALLVLLMKNLCNFNAGKVCSVLGNITQANVSRLTGIGLNLINTNDKFNLIFEGFVKQIELR